MIQLSSVNFKKFFDVFKTVKVHVFTNSFKNLTVWKKLLENQMSQTKLQDFITKIKFGLLILRQVVSLVADITLNARKTWTVESLETFRTFTILIIKMNNFYAIYNLWFSNVLIYKKCLYRASEGFAKERHFVELKPLVLELHRKRN